MLRIVLPGRGYLMDISSAKTVLYMSAVQYGIASMLKMRPRKSYKLSRALCIFAKRAM